MARVKATQADFSRKLEGILNHYSLGVSREMRKAITEVAAEMLKRIKAAAPKRRPKGGDYRKAMRVKVAQSDPLNYSKLWYVLPPHYRLTHLLENGHNLAGGGFVPGVPHIAPGEEWAEKELMKRLEGAIKDASK